MTTLSIKGNYLDYCRFSFKGKSNRTKVLICYVLYKMGGATGEDVAFVLRKALTATSVTSGLNRMLKKGKQIMNTTDSKRGMRYRCTNKGLRLLYYISHKEPDRLKEWLQEAGLK